MMTKHSAYILSVANQKGGVGKTTTTFNLGASLAELGFKVLLIDNDPQCNLTSYCGVNEAKLALEDIYITRRKAIEVSELTKISPKLFLLPAELELVGAEHYIAARSDREFILRYALRNLVTQFDYIVIDNPPALNMLTVNGLVASHGVVVPVQLEFFSLEGVVFLENTIASLQAKNPGLTLLGIVPNMFNDRRKLNWEVWQALKDKFKDKLFETKIHDSVKLAESSGHGESILAYARKSRPAQEFLDLAKEVVEHAQKTL